MVVKKYMCWKVRLIQILTGEILMLKFSLKSNHISLTDFEKHILAIHDLVQRDPFLPR